MKKIDINLKEKSYQIIINRGLLNQASEYISKVYKNKKIAIITDDNVNALYGHQLKNNLENDQYTVEIISVRPGEQSKTLDNVAYILERLSLMKLTRTDLIIAFGGGVVGDLAGFCASIYLRGVSYIQIPTTLLSQVDSSVGGKTAVDLPTGKNLAGSFYHPKMVLIDVELLKTLDQKFVSDGMGEVIKYACIYDYSFFEFLNNIDNNDLYCNFEYIVDKCINIKKYFVENDEMDHNERMKLNFGHTLGHAIESCFDFKKYTHGVAVCIGMYNITRLTEKNGLTKNGASEQIKQLFVKYGLDYKLPDMNLAKAMDFIRNDKKNESEQINIIYLDKIGEASIKKLVSCKLDKYIGELIKD